MGPDQLRPGRIGTLLKPKAAELGLNQSSLARQVRQAFYGEEAQRVQRGTARGLCGTARFHRFQIARSSSAHLVLDGASWQVLWPQDSLTVSAAVPTADKGFIKVRVPMLPLTYAALELITSAGSLWAHLRIKREAFDISGG